MMSFEDIQPSDHELALTTHKGMPEQVAIGHIKAARRANGGKRVDGPNHFDLTDLFRRG